MKALFTEVFIGILCVLFCLRANAQSDSLTIGKAFNWQVGDTFIYTQYQGMEVEVAQGIYKDYTSYFAPFGFVVTSKSIGQDSLLYSIRYFDDSTASLVFNDLDSNISDLRDLTQFGFYPSCFESLPSCSLSDTLTMANCFYQSFFDSSFNDFYTVSADIELFESRYDYLASEKTGYRGIAYSALEYYDGRPGDCGIQLIYYSSGGNSWADTAQLFTGIRNESYPSNDIYLFPDPASNILFVKLNLVPSLEVEKIKVYDLQSRLLIETSFSEAARDKGINISALAAGTYILVAQAKNSSFAYRTKFLKQ